MTDLSADHRIILARIDSGYPEWELECTHSPDDPKFHHYCSECGECDSPTCPVRHHDECILRAWWDENDTALITDTKGPITVPIPVRADVEFHVWRLKAMPVEPVTPVMPVENRESRE